MMASAILGGASAVSPGAQAFPQTSAVPSADRVDAFESALKRQGFGQTVETAAASARIEAPLPVEAPSPATEVLAAPRVDSVGAGSAPDLGASGGDAMAGSDDYSRARRGLGLDSAASQPAVSGTGGDMILSGIQRLRGVFDARQEAINSMMGSGPLNSSQLMAVQMEVTNFTMLIDISSKLTGKSTQAFETLMKGQ